MNLWVQICKKLKTQRNKPNTQSCFHLVAICCKPDLLFSVALQSMGNKTSPTAHPRWGT